MSVLGLLTVELVSCLWFSVFLMGITFCCLALSPQPILKKTVTMQQTPSAVYHYRDTGGGNVHHNKVNALFQAAKSDLLQVIQMQVIT